MGNLYVYVLFDVVENALLLFPFDDVQNLNLKPPLVIPFSHIYTMFKPVGLKFLGSLDN